MHIPIEQAIKEVAGKLPVAKGHRRAATPTVCWMPANPIPAACSEDHRHENDHSKFDTWIVLLLAAGGGLAALRGRLPPRSPAVLRDVGFDQRLNEQVPLDLKFTDETGRAVKLGDYFGNKPVILVMAYYDVPCSARWSSTD